MASRATATVLALALAAAACGETTTQGQGEAPVPAAAPEAPRGPRPADFSGERAWAELVTLCSFGPRAHGTTGWRRAQEHFRQTLTDLGFSVEDHVFEHQGVRDSAPTRFVTVIGRFRPDARDRVLVGSHYDTRLWADHDPDPRLRHEPIEGANDGGSGAAVLLELARVIAAHPPPHGVDLVFFDGEDYGPEGSPDYFLGSRALVADWQADPATVWPRAVVVLDMVGDADLRFAREAVSMERVPWLTDHVWDAGRRAGLGACLSDQRKAVIDDHTAFLEARVPATLLIDFEYPPWHTTGDTLDKCSAESLEVTGRLVVASVLGPTLPGD